MKAVMAVEDNPFRLPPDDQIFLIREQERQQRQRERERVKTLRVHEKTTASSRVHRSRRVDDGADDAAIQDEARKKKSSMRASRSESVGRDPRREKENVSDFVEKKREMFLVQMSLDVKKAEILKLDEKAKQKQEALLKAEQMLEEDVTRFDAFLQSNDQKAHRAMKDAEEEGKKKQEKLAKIKTLKSALSAIQSEIAKHREMKQECFKYKTFLEKLTPREWQEQQKAIKKERQTLRKQAWVDAEMSKHESDMRRQMEAEERQLEERAAEGTKKKKKHEAEEEARKREKELKQMRKRIKDQYPTKEQVENGFDDYSSGDEMPLHFESANQLLAVFEALEEKNLFLIQTLQESEQVLEEVQQQFNDKKREIQTKISRFESKIEADQRKIQNERQKCEELKQQINAKRAGSKQEELLTDLRAEVEKVYDVCGNDSDADRDTLEMLKAVEAKLEEFLTALDEAENSGHAALVGDLEKQKKQQRREQVRKENIEAQARKTEARLNASLERSKAPVHKKVGKQLMFRSAPLFQARKEVAEDDGFEQNVKDHDTFGIWIRKDGVPEAVGPPARP